MPPLTAHRSKLLRIIHARPRLFIALALGVLVYALTPWALSSHPITRWLLAWDSAMGLYVILGAIMMSRSADHHMRRRAQTQDEGKWVIIGLVVLCSLANLGAIAGELTLVREMQGADRWAHAGLAGATVLLSWAFIQVMFALHYAHDYYANNSAQHNPGLRFPDSEPPDYGDFFYFAAVIGTSGQTADVSFVSKAMRRLGCVHCILSYLFNTTVLAVMINIGASLV